MFPFMWHAYDRTPSREERLAPSGYIRVRGELWHAVVMGKKTPIEKGETVVVEGAYGLTLFVQPIHKILKRNDSS